jgi:hypothetical protein
MSAQAEEVVASAATMADMASQLESLAGRFRLGGESSVGFAEPADPPARRAAERPRWAA